MDTTATRTAKKSLKPGVLMSHCVDDRAGNCSTIYFRTLMTALAMTVRPIPVGIGLRSPGSFTPTRRSRLESATTRWTSSSSHRKTTCG